MAVVQGSLAEWLWASTTQQPQDDTFTFHNPSPLSSLLQTPQIPPRLSSGAWEAWLFSLVRYQGDQPPEH